MIETIEGIGGPLSKYHPVQETLAKFNGTQCGFCSAGMVMNMYALCKDGKPTMAQVENSFGGNLCRCTGYRPILSAFKSLCKDASPKLLGSYPDIEDFVMANPKSEFGQNEEFHIEKPLEVNFKKSRWTKVTTLKTLLDALLKLGDEVYMLVAGNTAKGVYNLPEPTTYIDVIDVKELISYEITTKMVTLGANMSLTSTLELFNRVAQMNSSFAHLKTMADHIDLIANVPVRNVGTLAGNLMMKHMHHEFASDIFLLLETFSAKLVIVDKNGVETTKSMVEFLNYDMKLKVIKAIQIPAVNSKYKYKTFKIMPRAQNAHAIVNAGFVFQLKDNIVKKATIVYGHINPDFVHATATEKYLTGKELFNNYTLQGAFASLSKELKTDLVLPEPGPEFRKQLAIALFYKAVMSLAPAGNLSPKNRSAGALLQRPISSGVQDYETNESLYPLTKAIPKLEALAQTSGQAEYVEDIPDRPHQLHAKFVVAEAPANSKIISIDATAALALKGVVRFFTKDDIPGENNFFPAKFDAGIVEKVFCDKTVEYYHQPVGLIVATDRNILFQATSLVKIEYSVPKKSPLLTIRDLITAKATDKMIREEEMKPTRKGDDIKQTISGKFDIGMQYHFHMELQCCSAVPTEDGLELYPSTQWMDITQAGAALVLNIPENKVHVNVRRCGGAFGGKLSRSNLISCATALAAWLLRKPVKLSMTLKENMEIIGKRFPFSADYEVKVNSGGVIQQLTSQIYSDHAVGGNEKINSSLIFDMFKSSYKYDTYDIVYYRTSTDTPANTYMRGPGSLEGYAYLEAIMDHIACELNMDPVDVRLNNVEDKNVLKYLNDMEEWANIQDRKSAIANFNKENRWKKKGISVIPMTFIYELAGPYTATVSIFHYNGNVTIHHGGIELGQGINTKAAQVCAYKFNIPLEKVNVYPSNTMNSPNNFMTGWSATSEAVCYSIDKACDELLARLKPYRTDENQSWEDLITKAYADSVLLTATGKYAANAPSVYSYRIYGASAAEVELDVLTGQYQITRVDLIEDVGTSLSPYVDIGQIEGAFVQGLGYFTTEKLVLDKDGKMLTNNTWFYKPPGAKDIPIDFRVKIPKNNPNPLGVLQSKAIGEPPLCLSFSVPLAIRHAIASARQDSDPSKSKFFFIDGPTTVETIFVNSLNDYKQYIL
ncbi:hypothetical protein WA026_017370 [Henosepilachna vigintioctopunctata]|uniref:Indole-3-acetaldehyde oxidase n=1 Tax=Henosepilachna vigintioctopunctata TaxID=420089 RepID=A0AAW1VDM6_9CUCU